MSRTYHHGHKWGHNVRARCKHLTGSSSECYNPTGRTYEVYTWFAPWTDGDKEWRRLYKHKKRRAELRKKLSQLRKGYDPEDMAWPLDKKPWIYYW